jgi:hypothetical protein
MHLPGSHHVVQFQYHHLVTWRAFHPSRFSQHYYGQVCFGHEDPVQAPAFDPGQSCSLEFAAPSQPSATMAPDFDALAGLLA